MQQTTRAVLYGLGLLSVARVAVVPRDQYGRDVELAELFPVPTAELVTVAARYLAEMDEEDSA
jgi:hypothetical protein